MSWNNAYETKKFEAKQKKQAEEYRALGMTEEQIQAMYEFDLEQFNSERRYREHTQAFIPDDFDEDEDDDEKLSIFEKFKDVLTVSIEDSGCKSRYWWVEEIENEELARKVKSLSSEEVEILTLLTFEGLSQAEAARIMGIPYRTFKYKLRGLKVFLKNI